MSLSRKEKPSQGYMVYLQNVLLPVTPSKIQTKINGMNKTITLINEGEVNQIKSNGLTDITFECLLPQFQQYPFAQYKDGKFLKASYFIDQFELFKSSKKPIKFKIIRRTSDYRSLYYTGSSSSGSYTKNTNYYVTLENYTITEDAKNGFDILVSINLKQYRDYGTKKFLKKKASGKAKVVVKSSKKTRMIDKTYTVKKGDTLLNIAKKQLGDSKKYTDIYSLNQSLIEKTAKKYGRKSSSNGYWIYPGTVLRLPIT